MSSATDPAADGLLLALDVGTQSTRAALVNPAGRVVASASTELELVTPRPGWAEQDPELWWSTTTRNVAAVLDAAPAASILAIGSSGQMHGAVPLGPDGALLDRSVQLWCDKRAAPEVQAFRDRDEALAAERIAGNPAAPAWSGFKYAWLRINAPELYERTATFLTPKDFINHRLTGELATDLSEASGSFLMDAAQERWSPELARLLEVDSGRLPPLHRSSEVIGQVTAAAARATGLREGTPVVAGGGDMLNMLLAAGITRPGRACDITGTSSILSVFAERPLPDERLMNLHHVMPGWLPFGIIDSGGGALRWFKDQFCQAEAETARVNGSSPYALLDEQARSVPAGADGLLFFPYLLGERTLGTPFARGVLFGFTPATTKGAVARAIMEGVCLELCRTLEIIEEDGTPVREVRTAGGGAQSELWSQLKADVYQRPVVDFETFEGGILGAAILAGVSQGVFADEAAGAEQTVRLARHFEPDGSLAERYAYLYECFTELHDLFQKPFERLKDMP